MNLKCDRPLMQNLSGMVTVRGDALFGFREDWSCRVPVEASGFRVVLDWLLDREKLVGLPQYEMLDELICLVVTTPEDEPSDLSALLAILAEERPLRSQVHWLHIQSGEGIQQADLISLFQPFDGLVRHVVDHETASERIHFDHGEWATVILMLQESLMVADRGAIDFDKSQADHTYGFASIDFSQSDGRRILHAQTYLSVLGRENSRAHVDEVHRVCNKALEGGGRIFSDIVSSVGQPSNLEDYIQRHESFESFNPESMLLELRQQLYSENGLIDKVNGEVERRLSELSDQIAKVIHEDCETAQVKLTVFRSLLGQLDWSILGKPMNPITTLDDCEQPALHGLHELGVAVTAFEDSADLQELRRIRRQCVELHDDLVSLDQEIDEAKEFGEDATALKEERAELDRMWVESQRAYHAKRTSRARARRIGYAQLSSNWLEDRISAIVRESRHIPLAVDQPEARGLSNREWSYVGASMVTLTSWVWEYWSDYPVGMIGMALWLGAAGFWTWFILNRYKKPVVHVLDPLIAQRDLWRKKAMELHDLCLDFAAIQRFERRFDEVVRKPVQREAAKLEDALALFRAHEPKARAIIETSFTPVQCVEQLGDRSSFMRYYRDLFGSKAVVRPIDLYSSIQHHIDSGRPWNAEEVVQEYLDVLEGDLDAKLEQLDGFHLIQYLLGEVKEAQTVSFLREDSPNLEELIRRVRIRLEPLHSQETNDEQVMVVFDGAAESDLVDRLKVRLKDLFEESKTNSMAFIPTDDPNRLSFIKVAKVQLPNQKKKGNSRARSAADRTGSDFIQPPPSGD